MLKVSNNPNINDPNSISFDERQKQLEEEAKRDELRRKKEEKDSPFSNFYQFNRAHSKEMIWLATNYPKAQAILLFLLDQMNNVNAVVCSYQVLQEALGISRPTITRAIKILKDHNFIDVYKSGTTNVYAVNKNLAWSSWGKNYKYAKFDAKIIIAASEQEKMASVKSEKLKVVKIKDSE